MKTEKRLRFEKVASTRVQKIINLLALLKNCSNTNNYEYEEKDVDRMFTEINKALKDAKNAYLNTINKSSNNKFSF